MSKSMPQCRVLVRVFRVLREKTSQRKEHSLVLRSEYVSLEGIRARAFQAEGRKCTRGAH